MEWTLKLPARPGGASGWEERPDLPLDDRLPDVLSIDVSEVQKPLGALFAVRLRTFIDWHRQRGRTVAVAPAPPRAAATAVVASGFSDLVACGEVDFPSDADVVVPATTLLKELDIEAAAERAKRLIEYEMEGFADLGLAVFQAISELCSNARRLAAGRGLRRPSAERAAAPS